MHVNSVYIFTSFVTFNTQPFSTKTNPLVGSIDVVCREERKGNTSLQSVEKTQSFRMLKQANEVRQRHYKSVMTKSVEMGISIVRFDFSCSRQEEERSSETDG
jgi:hypothetical protein